MLGNIPSQQAPEIALARALWELEKKRKALEDEAEELRQEYKAKAEELQTLLIDEGKSSTGHIIGVGEFAIKRESYMSVSKDRMPIFIQHLKESGHAAIVKESVEPGTLKKHLSDELEELSVSIERQGAFDALTQHFGTRIAQLWPKFVEMPAWKRSQAGEQVAPEELAADALKLLGVGVFQEVKLSHTKKGK